jgi:hypothetical protein
VLVDVLVLVVVGTGVGNTSPRSVIHGTVIVLIDGLKVIIGFEQHSGISISQRLLIDIANFLSTPAGTKVGMLIILLFIDVMLLNPKF